MIRIHRSNALLLCLMFTTAGALCWGQAAQPDTPAAQPAQTSGQTSTQAQPQSARTPIPSPYESGDGVWSFQVMYWRTTPHPELRAGLVNIDTYPTPSFKIPSNNPESGDVMFSIPTGAGNTLRVSYFRTQASGSTTVTRNSTLEGTDYAPGDLLQARYTLQNAKLSWDYLTWHWPPEEHRLLVKTLWEVQYSSIYNTLSAPHKAATDSAGNAVATSSTGRHTIVYPTLGVGIEYFLSKHFRIEAKGSGFLFYHRAVTYDSEAFLAGRFGMFEVEVGGRAFHFKSSPRKADYIDVTPYGAFVALRWYPSFH